MLIRKNLFCVVLILSGLLAVFTGCPISDNDDPENPDLIPPSEVNGPAAAAGTELVTLTWTDPDEDDFLRVVITADPAITQESANAGDQSCIIASLTPGTSYEFTLRTEDTSGNLSGGISITAVTDLPLEIASVSPLADDISGGTTVTISGNNIVRVADVTFGGTSASNISIVNTTTLTCDAPAHAEGIVDVELVKPGHTAVLENGFSYIDSSQVNITWAALQSPDPFVIEADSNTETDPVAARVYKEGVTDTAAEPAGISAQLGFGPEDSNPADDGSGWTWFDAAYNGSFGNNAEYTAAISAPALGGDYSYCYRFSDDSGSSWVYADSDGNVNEPGSTNGFSLDMTGTLTVTQIIFNTIAGHEQALESVLRAIPTQYIDLARDTFHITYDHTSHGTHVSYGLYGLERYKTGDDTLLAVSTSQEAGHLDFRDRYQGGGITGATYSDLSQTAYAYEQGLPAWDTWVDDHRTFLDDSDNAEINAVMWSWCSINGHDVSLYLSAMQTLIDEYGEGGSKIGTGAGCTRTIPVEFIFMTGHAQGSNTGATQPGPLAQTIIDYCQTHGYYCLDYYSIDTHTMDGIYYDDTSDNAESSTYAATAGAESNNFYQDWQNHHAEGTDYFYNYASTTATTSECGQHNTQHITANRKAYAMWWILARMAGWGE